MSSQGPAAHRERLQDSRDAIRDYLDSLLRQLPETDESESESEQPAAAAVDAAPAVPHPLPARDPEAAARQVMDVPEEADSGSQIPAWAADRFQVLFFYVGGLRLAVALTELHGVVPCADVDITPIPGQPDWQLGLMRHRGRNVRVIDTASMVLPPDKRESAGLGSGPSQILVVNGGTWGLACHGIGEVVRLDRSEVRWRSRQGKRPWLAGTVIGHLCALMAPEALTRTLEGSRDADDQSINRRFGGQQHVSTGNE